MTISYTVNRITASPYALASMTMEIEGFPNEVDAVRRFIDHRNSTGTGLLPKKLIFSGPCTILEFSDGSKSIVRCTKSEKFDSEKGVMMAYLKHMLPRSKWKSLTKQYHSTPKKEKAAAEALIRVDFREGVLRYLIKMINDAIWNERMKIMNECSRLEK